MILLSDKIVVEYRLGNFGYKLVKNDNNSYDLYYLSGDDEVEYGSYKTLHNALESAKAIAEIIRNP